MSEVKQRCCATVWNRFHSTQCTRNGKIERDGKWYCGTHDPVARKKKQDERSAKWTAEWEQRKEVEQLRNAAPDLLAALEMIVRRFKMDMYDGGRPDYYSMQAMLEKAELAIKKAKGE